LGADLSLFFLSISGSYSPDGHYMVFQESQGGFGQGWGRIYLFDFVAAGILGN